MSANLRKNVYICPHGHQTVTVDVDRGTTPFMTPCNEEGCEAMAHSTFYDLKLAAAAGEPTHEWYRPPYVDRSLSEDMQEHLRLGGLLLRRVGEVPTVGDSPVPTDPNVQARLAAHSAKRLTQSKSSLFQALKTPGIASRMMAMCVGRPAKPKYKFCDVCGKPTKGKRCHKCALKGDL